MKNKQEDKKIIIFNNLKRYFSLIIILLVVLTLSLSYYFLISPKLTKAVSEIQDSIIFQENIYKVQRGRLSQMQASLDFYRQISEEDLALLDSLLPEAYPKEKLFGEIEDLVILNGFILSGLSISEISSSQVNIDDENEVEEESKLVILAINFTINSIDYTAMKNFLSVLENHLPIMDIVSLNFSPSSQSLDLTIHTYYFKS